MVDQVVTTDAWLAQQVGSSTQYGNGTGGLITVGPAPSAVSGDPDYKGRGVFEVDLTTVFAGATSITAATFTAVVAGNSCIGSRGGTIRILLEELTADFGQKSATGDCGLGSGSGSGVWGISNNVDTTDSAFHSSGSHSTGDALTWDITAMLNRKLSEGATLLRFRLIAANTAGDSYDESNAARRITLYSVRDGTSGNRPKISVTASTGSVSKSASDSWSTAESTANITVQGTSPAVSDKIDFAEAIAVSVAAGYNVGLDEDSQGAGSITIGALNSVSTAILNGVSDDEVRAAVRFKLLSVPRGGVTVIRIILRFLDINNYYRLGLQIDSQLSGSLFIDKVVGGVSTNLATFNDFITLLIDEWHWMTFQADGLNPTALAGRAWAADDVAPTSWQIITQDTQAALQAVGFMGLQFRVGNVNPGALPIVYWFDDFEAIVAS